MELVYFRHDSAEFVKLQVEPVAVFLGKGTVMATGEENIFLYGEQVSLFPQSFRSHLCLTIHQIACFISHSETARKLICLLRSDTKSPSFVSALAKNITYMVVLRRYSSVIDWTEDIKALRSVLADRSRLIPISRFTNNFSTE